MLVPRSHLVVPGGQSTDGDWAMILSLCPWSWGRVVHKGKIFMWGWSWSMEVLIVVGDECVCEDCLENVSVSSELLFVPQ